MLRHSVVLLIMVAMTLTALPGAAPPPAAAEPALAVIATINVGPRPWDVAVDPDRNLIYVAQKYRHGSPGEPGAIDVINGATNQVVSHLDVEGEPQGLVVDPQSHHLFVGHGYIYSPENNNKVTVVETDPDGSRARIAATFDAGMNPIDLAVNLTTRRLYAVPGPEDDTFARYFRVFDLDTYELLAHMPTNGKPEEPGGGRAKLVAVDEANNRVYIAGNDGQMIFDGATNKLLATMAHPRVGAVAVNPTTGKYYATLLNQNTELDIWESAETILHGYPNGNHLISFPSSIGLAVDPGAGRVYATLFFLGKVRLLDADTDEVITDLKVGSSPFRLAVNSKNGLVYVTNEGSGTVSVIGPYTNQPPVCSSATVELLDGSSDGSGAEQVPVQTRGDQELVPNHKWVAAHARGITDPEGDPIALSVQAITQDEPVLDATTPDGRGLNTAVAEVRAERDGTGDGRVYQIGMRAADGKGGVCPFTLTVSVPRGNTPAVDSGQSYDSTTGGPVQTTTGADGHGNDAKDKHGDERGSKHKGKKHDRHAGKHKGKNGKHEGGHHGKGRLSGHH